VFFPVVICDRQHGFHVILHVFLESAECLHLGIPGSYTHNHSRGQSPTITNLLKYQWTYCKTPTIITTVETRNFEVAWFEIPVTLISFWSPKLFCYIINVNKIACLDIQSFDIFSHSMSIQSPNTTFHTLRLTHDSKSFSRLSFHRGAKSSACLSTISAQSRLV